MKNFINELQKDRNFIISQNNDILTHITENCIKHIKIINSSGNTSCVYEVPLFLYGYPLYDVRIISKAVNNKIKKMGLKSLYHDPNKIYISWKKN